MARKGRECKFSGGGGDQVQHDGDDCHHHGDLNGLLGAQLGIQNATAYGTDASQNACNAQHGKYDGSGATIGIYITGLDHPGNKVGHDAQGQQLHNAQGDGNEPYLAGGEQLLQGPGGVLHVLEALGQLFLGGFAVKLMRCCRGKRRPARDNPGQRWQPVRTERRKRTGNRWCKPQAGHPW